MQIHANSYTSQFIMYTNLATNKLSKLHTKQCGQCSRLTTLITIRINVTLNIAAIKMKRSKSVRLKNREV